MAHLISMPCPPRPLLKGRAEAVLKLERAIRAMKALHQAEMRALLAEALEAVKTESMELSGVDVREDGVILLELRPRER